MRVEESVLICPHCGTKYNEGESVCPSCGKPLSPTGYSHYGGDEPFAPRAPKPTETFPPRVSATSSEDRLNTPLIEAAPAPAIMPPVEVEPDPPASTPVLLPSPDLERALAEREAQATRQADTMATNLVRGCLIYALAAVAAVIFFNIIIYNHRVSTSSTLADGTPATPADPAASQMKNGYILFMSVVNYAGSLTLINISMYNLGTTPAIFPPDSVLSGTVTLVSATAVEFDLSSKAISTYKANDLTYHRGTALLPVVDGQVRANRLIILRDEIAAQRDYPRGSYVVAGQVDFGFDELDKLRSGGRVNQAGIIPDKVKATPTTR